MYIYVCTYNDMYSFDVDAYSHVVWQAIESVSGLGLQERN